MLQIGTSVVALRIALTFATSAYHIRTPVQVLTALLSAWVLGNKPGKATEDVLNPRAPPCVGVLKGVPSFWFQDGCCSHLRSEPVNGSVSLCLSNK